VTGDLTIRNGLIVDGTGSSGVLGDVAITKGRISRIGRMGRSPGVREIDATGLVVAPGFIDVHTHYDAQLCWDPTLASITQYGVTTVVMGNCGIGVAPKREGAENYLTQLLARVEGMSINALERGLSWDWSSFGQYLDFIDRPMGVNLVALVGHSPLRYFAMGEAAYERAAEPDEVARMQHELDAALDAGAWGFSSSVAGTHNDLAGRPAPSRLADWNEFEALANAVGPYPFGIIGISPESKLRGLSANDRALLQMLSLTGDASVNWNPLVHSPHIPELWRVNLSASEEAAASGARVYGVFNPAGTGGTRVDLNSLILFSHLPHWKPLTTASKADKLRALADPGSRSQLADDLVSDTSQGVLTARLRTMWNILRITTVFSTENAPCEGRLVGEIARERQQSPFDVLLDVALADDLQTVFMQEDARYDDPGSRRAFDVMARSPHVIYGGSDAGAHLDMLANESIPARALQRRVREEKIISLEEMVRRFTSAIADAIGVAGRGRLLPGLAGDVFIFDPENIGPGDAFVVHDLPGGDSRMVTTARGSHFTIVAGEVTSHDSAPTGCLSGRLLRAGRSE
jgi:N-acyl-D-aspartate/D-glutamate deacylase